jgi:hypothetical protein
MRRGRWNTHSKTLQLITTRWLGATDEYLLARFGPSQPAPGWAVAATTKTDGQAAPRSFADPAGLVDEAIRCAIMQSTAHVDFDVCPGAGAQHSELWRVFASRRVRRKAQPFVALRFLAGADHDHWTFRASFDRSVVAASPCVGSGGREREQ